MFQIVFDPVFAWPATAYVPTPSGEVEAQPFNRLEVQVIAWGVGDECWIIRHEILMGDPSGPDVWKALDEFLTREWPCENGPAVTIRATCVDTGGRHSSAA